MGNKAIQKSTLVSVADAIRAKTSKTDVMTLDMMVTEIGALGGVYTPDFSAFTVKSLVCNADFIDETNRLTFMLLLSQMADISAVWGYYPKAVDFTGFIATKCTSFFNQSILFTDYAPAGGKVVSPGRPDSIVWPTEMHMDASTFDGTVFMQKSVGSGKMMTLEQQASFIKNCKSAKTRFVLSVATGVEALLTTDEIASYRANVGDLYFE